MCRNYNSNKRSIWTTIVIAVLCLVIVTGSTFSLFTSKSGTDIAITSGNLDMTAMIDADSLVLYSMGAQMTRNFANGGYAAFNNAKTELSLNKITPGDSARFNIVLTNNSNIDFKYRVTCEVEGILSEILVATVNSTLIVSGQSEWMTWNEEGNTKILAIEISLPTGLFGDEFSGYDAYKGQSATIAFAVEAVQANGVEEYEESINPPKVPTVVEQVEAPAIDENGATTESVEIEATDKGVSATIPEGVKLAEGVEELTLSIKEIADSQANVEINEAEETKVSLDVHIEGISEENDVPMAIKLDGVAPKGLNDSNIKLYHVENGVTVQMTQVGMADEFTAHNQFKYDAVTGDLILNLASFSEVAVVSDNVIHWDGKSATAFAGGSGTEADPYLIANASQLAFFRDVVDGGKTFNGEFVKLTNDVILNHHGETSNQFDPIGWGYDNAAYNRGGAAGKVFMGTFDGDGHGIHGLWQNGWDLEAMTSTDYTYTNCGFGLFASVKDATIKNLQIKHANVTVECVEAGILVGLAQGSCTFENIMIYQSQIANYQRPAGGVVGEVSPGFENGEAVASNHRFINVHVGSSCTVGSLWGDFDTPCGGVIGAYWDDTNNTTVYMKDVDVSCVLDVYNDVTSAYQWYAYRRAGMLIGNTDQPPADGKNAKTATADFLTCENCIVIYDYWVDYKYCQFTNDNNPGKNYPWVRIQGSQYNGAYSNPRYGHPVDALGNTVTTDDHKHKDGDTCHEYIPFNQLYGGGQGVYGQPAHEGVTIGKYVVVYMEGDEIYDVKYVADNVDPFDDFLELESGYDWIDMNGVHYTKGGNNKIPVGNTKDYVLYKNTINTRMIRFVDARGFVITEQLLPAIDKNKADESYYKTFYESKLTIPDVPQIDGYVGVWPEWWKIIKETPADQDVAIHAVYTVIYEGDPEADDKNEVEIMDENGDTGDLFKMISQGKSVVMYKGLEGNIGNASIKTFATVGNKNYTGWVSNHARLDLDSYTLIYENDSNANHNWTLFKILNGASMTVGGGLNQSGSLVFQFNKMKGDAPCLFDLEEGAVLHLERGVTIEMRFSKSISGIDKMMEDYFSLVVKGHTHADGDEVDHHPGLNITLDKTSMSGYYTVRIEVTSYTTLVGGNHQ